MSKIPAGKSFIMRLYFSWYLLARTAHVIIKPNRFCYYVQKGHGFRENLVSVMVSTFLIFMFVDQLLLVDVFSQLYLCQKTTMSHFTVINRQNHEKSITSI